MRRPFFLLDFDAPHDSMFKRTLERCLNVAKLLSITRGSQKCDHCGRSIMVLCAVEIDGAHKTVGSSCVAKFVPELADALDRKLRIFAAAERRQKKQRDFEDRQAKRRLEFEARLQGTTATGSNLVRIVEPLMLHGLSSLLMDDGFTPTDDETIFSAPSQEVQETAIDTYEGVEPVVAVNPEYVEAVQFLKDYTGNFSFLQSLRAQLTDKGFLSDRQLDSAVKCMNNDKARQALMLEPIVLKDAVVTVKRWFAKYKVLDLTGLKVAHFNFQISKVFRITEKAFEVEMWASGKPTTCCSVCGIRLTNDESIKLGIGPICREKYGVPDFSALEKELHGQVVGFRVWLPKVAIVDEVNFYNQLPKGE